MQQRPITGIDHLLSRATVDKGKRMAMVTNDSAFTSERLSSRLAILKKGFNLVKLFSPEHGLTTAGADGVFQNNHTDKLTGLPVISLYGDRLAPSENDLNDIDIVLFDIPDIGCRFYTYLWTMAYVMGSCASFDKKFIIADRPNPIGGRLLQSEGPMLDEEHCSSFIGRWSMPVRHSCTLGEIAKYFAATRIKSCQLDVIPVSNWQRDQMADESGWQFIPTSPAIQKFITALVYPGMGLLEGINVDEGRGTDNVFNICGAPWINAGELREAFTKSNCPGISCQPYSYKPAQGLYANQNCNGLKISVTDATIFRPVNTGIALLQTIIELYPDRCEERLYKTRANPSGLAHLDKLLGVNHAFLKIKHKETISTEVANEWHSLMRPFLLY